MKRISLMLGMTLVVGITIGVMGTHILNAQYAQQQAPLKVTELLKADVVGMEGKEVIVQLVEVAPRGASGKHYHPGHEANYILEGSITLEMEGHPLKTLKAGDSSYIPAKLAHEAKNASTTNPAKALAFRLHEKGQPVTVSVTKPYFQ